MIMAVFDFINSPKRRAALADGQNMNWPPCRVMPLAERDNADQPLLPVHNKQATNLLLKRDLDHVLNPRGAGSQTFRGKATTISRFGRRVCSADCRSVQTMLEAPSTERTRHSRANRCCSSASPAGFVRRNSVLKILKSSSSRGGHLHQSAPLLSRILQHLAPLTDRLLELRGDGALSSAPLCSLIQGVAYHPIEEDPVASPPPISLARRRQESKEAHSRGAVAISFL